MRAIDGDILEKKLKDAINMCMSIDTSGLSELKAVLEDVEKMPTIEPQRKKGTWIEQDDSWDGVYYECSACGEPWTTIDGTPWDNGMKFCPNCGVEMTEESEESKRCDTCKYEKSHWFSRCADCSDYELWEEKDETGRSTTEN